MQYNSEERCLEDNGAFNSGFICIFMIMYLRAVQVCNSAEGAKAHRNVRDASYLVAVRTKRDSPTPVKLRTSEFFPCTLSCNAIQWARARGKWAHTWPKSPGEERRGAALPSNVASQRGRAMTSRPVMARTHSHKDVHSEWIRGTDSEFPDSIDEGRSRSKRLRTVYAPTTQTLGAP